MNIKELKVKYKKQLIRAAEANGRKETIFHLKRAAKIRSKIFSKTKIDCSRCIGTGFLRVSLDETRTCLSCYGKGFLIEDKHQF